MPPGESAFVSVTLYVKGGFTEEVGTEQAPEVWVGVAWADVCLEEASLGRGSSRSHAWRTEIRSPLGECFRSGSLEARWLGILVKRFTTGGCPQGGRSRMEQGKKPSRAVDTPLP